MKVELPSFVRLQLASIHKEHDVPRELSLVDGDERSPVVLLSIAGPGTLTWLGEADLGFHLTPFGEESDAPDVER